MTLDPLHPDFDGYLYHATAARNLDAILTEGLNAGSYLSIGDIADYYAETVEDDGETPVILKVRMDRLAGFDFAPDHEGIEEPISTVVGKSEDEIWETWSASDQTWQDCFRLIGSVKINSTIPGELISIDEDC